MKDLSDLMALAMSSEAQKERQMHAAQVAIRIKDILPQEAIASASAFVSANEAGSCIGHAADLLESASKDASEYEPFFREVEELTTRLAEVVARHTVTLRGKLHPVIVEETAKYEQENNVKLM